MRLGKKFVSWAVCIALVLGVVQSMTGVAFAESAAPVADVSVWDFGSYADADLAAYNEKYGVDLDRTATVSTNGGAYGSCTLPKCYDGDWSSYWLANKTTDTNFQSYVEFHFSEKQTIGRMIYAVQPDGNGFPLKFKIYGSNTDSGEDFTLVATGSYARTTAKLEISFPEQEFKRLRFVGEQLNTIWLSVAEIRFYKADNIKTGLTALFTDVSCTALRDGVNQEMVDRAWNAAVAGYPQFLLEPMAKYRDKAYVLLNLTPPALAPAASVKPWDLRTYTDASLTEYNRAFGVDVERRATVTTNAGHRDNLTIQKCYDGNWESYWLASRSNSASFETYVEFHFPEKQTIGRIIYAVQPDGNGFPLDFKIYGSETDSGNTFVPIAIGSASKTAEKLEISFPERDFKRLRFVGARINTAWMSAAELRFYRADSLISEVKSLFTDSACTSLVYGVTMAQVKGLAERVDAYPLKQTLQPYIDTALILLGGAEADPNARAPITLSQKGNRNSECGRTQTSMTLGQFDLTGYYARPGETIGVYVHADENGPMPRFVLATANQHPGGWCFGYDGRALANGYNEIKVPDTMPDCQAIYFYNPAIPSEQAFAPVVRIVGGTPYPVYRYDSKNPENSEDPDVFLERLRRYCDEVVDIDAEANAGNGKYNICELTSDKVIVTISARGALIGLQQAKTWNRGQGTGRTYKGAKDTMELYDMLYDDMMLYSGFNVTDPAKEDYKPYCQFLFRAYTDGAGLGWGQSVFAGFNMGSLPDSDRWEGGFYASLATVDVVLSAGWAVFHEIGHVFDNSNIGTSESTNNLYGLAAQLKYLGLNRLEMENRWYHHFTNYINTKVLPSNDLLFYPGAVIYQLDAVDFSATTLYKDEGISNYGRACRYSRLHANELRGMSYTDRLVVSMSMGAGVDLSSHFEYYGRSISEEARWLLKGLPKDDRPTWFVNDRTFKGTAFDAVRHNTKPEVSSVTVNDATGAVTLHMNQDTYANAGSDNDLQCFAVYRQDVTDSGNPIPAEAELIGVTGDNKSTANVNELYIFTDTNVTPGHTYAYSVSAYDCALLETPRSDAQTVAIADDINVPVTILLLNNGDEGYTSNVGFRYRLQAKYFPANATVNLNDIRWEIRDNITGAGTNSVRISPDPDYPNDPTRVIITGIRQGSTRVYVSLGGLTQSYRFVVNGGTVALQSIALDHDSLTMQSGDTVQVSVLKTPDYTTDTTAAVWSSNHPEVATVEDGMVTAVGTGNAVIQAQIGNKTAQCTVTVAPEEILAERITIRSWGADGQESTMTAGESKQLTAEIAPLDATNANALNWSIASQTPLTEGETVATIDRNGNVNAISAGTATVEARVGGISQTIVITVKQLVAVKFVTINYPSYTLLHENDSVRLVLTPNPADASGAESVVWKSGNTDIVTVEPDGTVHPVTGGQTTVTGYWNGKYAVCNISVAYEVEMTGLKFKGAADNADIAVSLMAGDSYQLSLSPIPIRATNVSSILWESGDTAIATVDAASGYITAVSEGTVNITGSITQSMTGHAPVTKTLTCAVTVRPREIALTSVAINKVSHSMKIGETAALALTKRPINANTGITEPIWSSSAPEVAAVDGDGIVTAVAPGTAVITGTIGSCSADCVVTVQAEEVIIHSVSLDRSEYAFDRIGDSQRLIFSCDPASEAGNAWWSSSDSNVVRVDQTGTMTAASAGRAVITATVKGKSAACVVTVPGLTNASCSFGAMTTVTVNAVGDTQGVIFIAVYDAAGKNLAEVRMCRVSDTIQETFENECDAVKIFWWRGVGSITPEYPGVAIFRNDTTTE